MDPKPNIINEEAISMFDILTKELKKNKLLNKKTLILVNNIVMLEQLKQDLLDDIKERGTVELFKNGSQEMYRENKSIDKVLKIVEQQRKLQAELKMTPASEKTVPIKAGGKKDDFENF